LENENKQKIYSDKNPEMINFLKEKKRAAIEKTKNENENFELKITNFNSDFSVEKEPQNFSAEFVNNLLDALEN